MQNIYGQIKILWFIVINYRSISNNLYFKQVQNRIEKGTIYFDFSFNFTELQKIPKSFCRTSMWSYYEYGIRHAAYSHICLMPLCPDVRRESLRRSIMPTPSSAQPHNGSQNFTNSGLKFSFLLKADSALWT